MTLFVDFNMTEADGRVVALLHSGRGDGIAEGIEVTATDGEGTECVALVTELSPDRRYAMLAPVEGTWKRDSVIRPSMRDLLAY